MQNQAIKASVLALVVWLMGLSFGLAVLLTTPSYANNCPVVKETPTLIWPVRGKVSSCYGSSHLLGIDIEGREGDSVVSATAGKVVFAGGNRCCSYGLYVIIFSQDSSIETLYAHLERIDVRLNEDVEIGEPIGLLGSTGYSTEPHLHFETIRNGIRVNPLNLLP